MVSDVSKTVDKSEPQNDGALYSGSLQNESFMIRRQEALGQNRGNSIPASGFIDFTAISGFEPGRHCSARDIVLACSTKPGTENCPTFKPDYRRKTESARQWDRDAVQRSKEQIELGPDQKYEVKKGDSLTGIAERLIMGANGKADPREVAKVVKGLIETNKDAYPHLLCNSDLIRPGMRLKMPPEANDGKRGTTGVPPGDSSAPPSVRGGENATGDRGKPPRREVNTDPSGPGVSVDSYPSQPNVEMPAPSRPSSDYSGSEFETIPPSNPPTKPESSNLDEMRPRLRELIGKPPSVLDRSISPRLACAIAVSDAVNSADPRIRRTVNSNQLERDMIAAGYERVPLDQVRPGDVIIGKRPDNMPGHAAIYMGDGKIFNNDSNAGKMQIDSVEKFRQGMHDRQGRWNPNGYSQVVAYRRKAMT